MQKIAVITGAGGGIGARLAYQLATDGCDIAALDINQQAAQVTVDTLLSLGVKATAIAVDITDEDSVNNAIAQVKVDLGLPNILVNCAGIMRSRMLSKMTVDDWDIVQNVNMRGTFLVTRAVAACMREAQWGRIVNIASTAVLGYAGAANYAAAKAGVVAFTKTLALELGRFNVTANAIAPGFIATDMTKDVALKTGTDFAQMELDQAAKIPVGRNGTPDDIANAVSFFVSEKSGFVSGQLLYLTGGPVI